jgi:tetratricopeptide (TPR) repeat protein
VQVQELERAVSESPEDARARINLGIAYFQIGSGADAAREFLAASLHARDAEVAATAHFDLGVVALRENDLPRASDAFFDALVLNPEDEGARFNLEWTLELQRKEGAEETTALGESNESSPPAGESAAAGDASESAPNPDDATGTPVPNPGLTAAERQRWLDRVTGDPRQWLRSIAGDARNPATADRDPAW